MTVDIKTLGVVGLAIAAPSLMPVAQRAGVPIPAYVTDAHRLAIASLQSSGLVASVASAADMAAHRQATYKNAAPMDKQRALAMCDAMLDACLAGVLADAQSAYELTEGQNVALAMGTGDLREAVWAKLEEGDGRDFTDLGRAAAQVMARERGVRTGFLSTAQDLASVTTACGVLAVEMDNVGYLITGKPEHKTIAGGFAAAGEAVAKFVADKSLDAAGVAARALFDVLLGHPLLLVGTGVVAWRVLR
jgi:hypothetical protein